MTMRRPFPTLFLMSAAAVSAAGGALASSARSAPQDADAVRVEGGPDASGQRYVWRIANHSASPVTGVEFPHYHADLFAAPAGWKTESTFLVNVGVADRPGVCRATAPDVRSGIQPGDSAEFSMRIAATGAPSGTGVVKLRFASGASLDVGGVQLPRPPSRSDTVLPLVALAACLGVVLIVRHHRRGSRQEASADAPPS